MFTSGALTLYIFFSLLKLQPGTKSQNASLLFKSPALIRLPPFKYAHLYFFFPKEKYGLGRKDCDSSTSAKVGGAGLGRDHHEWGQWREEGSTRQKGRQSLGKVLREWELGKVSGEPAKWQVGPAAAPQRATSRGRAAATGPRA